ncbi:AbrB/MazE/SpoVT family DNA-binding domain-containing protein [Roseateles sp. DAIF2]|uniref:AbrB/MazE/SpoVT family DNA-binding domain-containing protein n=1 Tax=Roseateles sp. DAIF2 TaxID=2714952 RepID=UPI00201E4FF5|nr:AbrB/MazE/SpoVT family DNA-binding domain-containing protein [Roseateles sp. DAIF2]
MLAKLTSKNQLTLPKSVTEAIGPVQYFEVQARAGQIILTPVRIQRGDALRAKLAELDLGEAAIEKALDWAAKALAVPAKKKASGSRKAKPAAAPEVAPARKVARKTATVKTATAPKTAARKRSGVVAK